MAMSRWSPMGELASLHSTMDKLFSDVFASPAAGNGAEARTWYLPLDVVDQGNAYQVKGAIPGFKPEEVEVTYRDGLLSIKAQHREESESTEGDYLRRELTYGNFARNIQLPGDVKADDIKATFDAGMLTVEIPKVPAPQPVKIPITGAAK
jgi:HSP20 family protein